VEWAKEIPLISPRTPIYIKKDNPKPSAALAPDGIVPVGSFQNYGV
jgi:hypothetical protein